jgi:thermostable 8-oxoguanine DNA glycosylase
MSDASSRATTIRNRLVSFLRNLPPDVLENLNRRKTEGQTIRSRPDWLWYSLITSFSTMGNSRGYAGLMADPEILKSISYDNVAPLTPLKQRSIIEAALKRATVRMYRQKTEWLTSNFKIIEKMGGVSLANKQAFSQPGRAAKIAFLQQFHGVGDKYSRNIWMDIYDPDFHDAIAVDDRIKKVSAALGVPFSRYADHERYYQSLAGEVGMQPWELDRVLYGFQTEVLNTISASQAEGNSRGRQFRRLLKNARSQACKAGMTKSDITTAIRKVQKRS